MINIASGLFTLLHAGDAIGTSNLESGDPDSTSASGVFNNLGGAKALAGWLKSIGGSEDEGAVFVGLDQDFELQTREGDKIAFSEGSLIAVPEADETFLELSGIPQQTYRAFFAGHIEAAQADQQ